MLGTSTDVVGASVVDRGSSSFFDSATGSEVDSMGVSILGASLETFEALSFSGDFDRVKFLNPEVNRRPRDSFRGVSGLVSEVGAGVSSVGAVVVVISAVSGAGAEVSAVASSPFVRGAGAEVVVSFFPRSARKILPRFDFSGFVSGEAGVVSSVGAGADSGALGVSAAGADSSEVSLGAGSGVVSFVSLVALLFANRLNPVIDLRFSFLVSGAGVSKN